MGTEEHKASIMNNALVISVRLHEGWYHGAGSIPSPARVFQALMAGRGLSGPIPPESIEALEWLERQPPQIEMSLSTLSVPFVFWSLSMMKFRFVFLACLAAFCVTPMLGCGDSEGTWVNEEVRATPEEMDDSKGTGLFFGWHCSHD